MRLLRENEIFHNVSSVVGISEKKGEGHWFDGVVDDDELQNFLDLHLSATRKPVLPTNFTLFTMNPASSGSRGGIRILSLEVAYESSRIRVRQDFPSNGDWTINTENVRRFRYEVVNGILERPTRLFVDGDQVGIPISPDTLERRNEVMDFCMTRLAWGGNMAADIRLVSWKQCKDTKIFGKVGSAERGPDNSGPAFQVLSQRKVAVVYPEGDLSLMGFAIRYSNSLYLRGISVIVTTDSNVTVKQMSDSGDVNIVLFGGPSMNQMAKTQSENGFTADVTFSKKGFCVNQFRCFEESGTGIAFLSGGPRRTLLFFVAGTDRNGMEGALDFLPYSPASNVPEWVVTKASRGWGFRGLGGVVAMGYWNWMWRLEPRRMYPSEFGFDPQMYGASCGTGIPWFRVKGTAGILAIVVTVALAAAVAFMTLCRSRMKYSELQKDEDIEYAGSGIQRGKRDDVARIEKAQLLSQQVDR